MMTRMHLYIAVCALSILCLLCGCLGNSTVAPTPAEGGIKDSTIYSFENEATFDAALTQLERQIARGEIEGENISVRQVNGVDLNISAYARSWIIGRETAEGSSLLIYNPREGWREEPWMVPLPEEEIKLDEIVSPTELYAGNEQVIGEAMAAANVTKTDLELSGMNYTVIVRSSTNISILSFYADTGEMVE
jgi:hypothetical protein